MFKYFHQIIVCIGIPSVHGAWAAAKKLPASVTGPPVPVRVPSQ